MKLEEWEALFGFKLAVIFAGLVGSLVQLAMHPKLSIAGALVSVLAGAACAAYVTPLIRHYQDLPAPLENSLAFVLGLIGLQLTAKIYSGFEGISIATLIQKLLKK